MARTILATVGTSAAKQVGPGSRLTQWIGEQGSPEEAAESLFQRFAEAPPEGAALQTELSAEVHCLVRLELTAADRVQLLTSDTDAGLVCGRAVALYLQKWWPGLEVIVDPVPGVQVHDARRFQRVGTVEFTQRCLRAIESYGADNVVLTPTGGYKALIPYAVLIGMLKGVSCRYIFEQSTSLIELPPFPVEFRRSLYQQYQVLLDRFERETAISRKEWESLVPWEDRSLLQPLVEVEGNQVTTSALGDLFLNECRRPVWLTPFLSQAAWEDCLYLSRTIRECDPFRYLNRVAASREALRKAEHINVGGGLRWLKPGNTTDRYLVSVDEWRLLVWRAVREDEVGADYAAQVQINPEKDRSRFVPFARMEFVM